MPGTSVALANLLALDRRPKKRAANTRFARLLVIARLLSFVASSSVLAVTSGSSWKVAFFRCLGQGLLPESPSEDGVISRVVQTFALYAPEN